MALTQLIIVCGERSSRSEPRKPLKFPQRKKEGKSEMNERRRKTDRWRKQGGKGVTKCVPNEKRRPDEKACGYSGVQRSFADC